MPHPSKKVPRQIAKRIQPFWRERQLQEHTSVINQIVWSPDGMTLASASRDKTIRLWDANTGKRRFILEGHTDAVVAVAWSPNGTVLASGAADKTIRFWDAEKGRLLHTIEVPSQAWIRSLAWSPTGKMLAAAFSDGKIRIWDTDSKQVRQTLEGHSVDVICVAWIVDGSKLASGTIDHRIHIWNLVTGKLIQTLDGHTKSVNGFACSPTEPILASASTDHTVRLWNAKTGRLTHILVGHTDEVDGISFSFDSRLLASASMDRTVRIWRCDQSKWEKIKEIPFGVNLNPITSVAFHPKAYVLATFGEKDHSIYIWRLNPEVLLQAEPEGQPIHYRNAKVVLVGNQGVGKSGLAICLAQKKWKPTQPTHSREVWHLAREDAPDQCREILLWDLAGQADYRLIHQLSLDQTNVALVVFDGSDPDDPFKGVTFWSNVLNQAEGSKQLVKYLVAARADASPLSVTEEGMQLFALQLGFQDAFITSAKTGQGIPKLREQIRNAINWNEVPITRLESVFRQVKDFILKKKNTGQVLETVTNLMNEFRAAYPKTPFSEKDFRSALGQMEAHDLVKQWTYGDYVLLKVEILDHYASAMVLAARNQSSGLGFLDKQAALEGWFNLARFERADKDEEQIVLQLAVNRFIKRELAIDDEGKIIFPSQVSRERLERHEAAGAMVSYKFNGPTMIVYTTLVVRLYHSKEFKLDWEALWKNKAAFLPDGLQGEAHRCGIMVRATDEGHGVLTVFFGEKVEETKKILFLKFIEEHLRRKAWNGAFTQKWIYYCPRCGKRVKDNEAVDFNRDEGRSSMPCQYCRQKIHLEAPIKMTSEKEDERCKEIDKQSAAGIERDRHESALLGKIMARVAEAEQIFRPTKSFELGIDGEIEFKDKNGNASGKRIYLHFKSGDTPQDEERILRQYIERWRSQRYIVYSVFEQDAKIYWSNVTPDISPANGRTRSQREEMTLQAIEAVRNTMLVDSALAKKTPISPRARTKASGKSTTGQFDVFLSYNSQDSVEFVKEIVKKLRQRRLKPWFDKEQLPAGQSFYDYIVNVIPKVKSAAIIVGSKGLGKFQELELRRCISVLYYEGKPVIPVLLPGAKIPTEEFFLDQMQWVRFEQEIDDENAWRALVHGIKGQSPQINKPRKK